MNNVCEHCHSNPFSLADREYLRLFGHCWECDKKMWDNGEISLEEFERRETIAQDSAVSLLNFRTNN